MAAFYDITLRTTYSRPVIEAEFGADIAEMVQTLRRNENEKIREYISRCAQQEHADSLVCIILAVLLQEERGSDICPFESWEEDIPYYKDLAEQIEPYISAFAEKGWDGAAFLGKKLLEQIHENMDFSRDRNKTTQELYAGWDDDYLWQ